MQFAMASHSPSMSTSIPPGPRNGGVSLGHQPAAAPAAAKSNNSTTIAFVPSISNTGAVRADPSTLAKLCGHGVAAGSGSACADTHGMMSTTTGLTGPRAAAVPVPTAPYQLSTQSSHSASSLTSAVPTNLAANVTAPASTSTISIATASSASSDHQVSRSASDALNFVSQSHSHSIDSLSVTQSQQRAQHLATRRGTHAGTASSLSSFMAIPPFQNTGRRASAYTLRDPRVAPIASESTALLTPVDRLAALSGLIRSFATLPTDDDPVTDPTADNAPPPRFATPLTSISLPHTATSLTLTSATDSSYMYTTHRTLVEGSAGKIKLATHVLTGEQVVIKCLDKSTLQIDLAAWHAAMREIAVTASLAHPNIAPLLQVMDTLTSVQLVFQYEPGGDLLEYLVNHAKERTAKFEKKLREEANAEGGDQGSPPKRVLEPFRRLGGQLPAELRSGMSEARARHLVAQVVHAVEHCHSRGIVHRDLKPENILINSMGHVQLIDFGFTNVLDDPSHLMTTFCGSISYAAPEMLAKQPYAGMPCDIWSLGVTIFVVVTGYLPFDESSIAHMYQHMMARKVEYPSTMTDELKDLLHRMLDPDPATRFTIHQVQASDWFDVERREAPYLFVASTPPPPSQPSLGSGSTPPTFRPARMPVHLPTLRLMLDKFGPEFPDAHRTADLVAARTPSPEFATYMLLLGRGGASRHPMDAHFPHALAHAHPHVYGSSSLLAHSAAADSLASLASTGGGLSRSGSAASSDDGGIGSAPLSPVVAGKHAHGGSGGSGGSGPAHLGNQRWNSFTRHSLAALEVQLELVAEEVGAEAVDKEGTGQGTGEERGEEDPGVREAGDGASGSMPPAAGLAGLGARPARVGMTIVEEEEEEEEE